MKQRKFRLQRALDVRRLQAGIERARWERLLSDVRRMEGIRGEIARQRAEADRVKRKPSLLGAELAGVDAFGRFAVRADAEAAQRQAQAQRRADAQRGLMVEADRQVKVLERLEERSRREWTRAFDKELEQMADEAFLAKRNRERAARKDRPPS